MKETTWKIVKHGDASDADKLCIAKLKDQHWSHGVDSQLSWMEEFTRADDFHLMGFRGSKLISYATVSRIRVNADGRGDDFLGIGGVCVDKSVKRSGYGKKLVEKATDFINGEGKRGILLCKDALVGFYEKCGWSLVTYGRATVAGEDYGHRIMTCSGPEECEEITVDRNF